MVVFRTPIEVVANQAATTGLTRAAGGDIIAKFDDAMYANGPVNYVKIDRLPTVDDMSPIINAMKRDAGKAIRERGGFATLSRLRRRRSF